ncbi:hypothetical protein ILUMI_07666 [Ignelater luminosus]|uniref:Uncharacterized protein n=1 Tax=Ignelater luminosus TaxID=2038154 RepID=A0A8K0D3F5_IGNLU|nr:hypothetical protein ILUMI_07666 [Ignelater luminosus]
MAVSRGSAVCFFFLLVLLAAVSQLTILTCQPASVLNLHKKQYYCIFIGAMSTELEKKFLLGMSQRQIRRIISNLAKKDLFSSTK